eukprot:GHVU01060773.1.p3 GENE.GHVU01060773.1~~GHVU01060773.1.p3  ORF type:complete len:104 (-),score=9.55 GHVU01060773.1:4-315(-)
MFLSCFFRRFFALPAAFVEEVERAFPAQEGVEAPRFQREGSITGREGMVVLLGKSGIGYVNSRERQIEVGQLRPAAGRRDGRSRLYPDISGRYNQDISLWNNG